MSFDTVDLMRVRIPTTLKTKLREAATANDRSMNAELLQILKAHFVCHQSERTGNP
ncbi:Arc family DNA-binding protein [Rhizobium leguminosarum]|uniref:Arc family DNA-binding protein n=1 Tax=Rhizobium brockwellii TaxID=3019932 RepID=UPI001031B98C|nr:Arc family DNA-binding protein [Rhizobium leguminosarum]